MYYFYAGRCEVVLIVLLIYTNTFCSLTAASSKEHSRITLYQGTDKFDLDAKDCPVGLSLNEAERFSCACINGIWAFYENPCKDPIAIVGGNNYCFQMPSHPIKMAIAVSNPLRAMGEVLTIFESGMEGIRSKVYRSMHLRLTDADKFITLNSNWTLTSPDGTQSICLESQKVAFEGLTRDQMAAFPDSSYCSYADFSAEMPFIGSVKKGCNSTMMLEAVQCQPMLPNNGDICMNDQILKDYQELIASEPILEMDNSLDELTRPSRALKNLGRFSENNEPVEAPREEREVVDITEKVARAYRGQPEWHRRISALLNDTGSVLANITTRLKATFNRTQPTKVDFEKAWKNPNSFLTPIADHSDYLVVNHLWIYRRIEIRDTLNVSRLVPPDDDLTKEIESGKIKKLLGLHKDIMKKVCPLAPSSFFETVAGTFLAVLTKGFRWKEPFVDQTHYLRILSSLSLCKNKATMMEFAETDECSYKQETGHIVLPSAEGNDTVYVPLEIPEVFQTGNFEPMIEAVWKMFVTVHSYCFKDFKGFYQDHHKYTSWMVELFSNQLHDIWVRNKTIAVEYGGVLGNLGETMLGLEKCAVGARMVSEYPLHLIRPTKRSKYGSDNEMISYRRPKRSAPEGSVLNSVAETLNAEGNPVVQTQSLNRKRRLIVNSINSATRLDDTIFNGRGICFKQYGDQKMAVRSQCRKHNEKS